MMHRFSIAMASFVCLGALLPGCHTPEVTPGFKGTYKTASTKIWSLEKSITPYGHIYFPTNDGFTVAPEAMPCPVLVFIPGFLEPALFYNSYAEQAASWGYIVVLVQLVGTSDAEFFSDIHTIIAWLEREQEGYSLLAGAMNLDQLCIAGHSLGGKYALISTLTEPRIRAVTALDPVDGAAGLPANLLFALYTPDIMAQVTVPSCIIGAEYPGALNPTDKNYHNFYLAATCPAEEILVYDTDHASFADDYRGLFQHIYDFVFAGKPTEDNRAKDVSIRYMISWFNVHVRDQEEFQTYLTGARAQEDAAEGIVRIDTKNMP